MQSDTPRTNIHDYYFVWLVTDTSIESGGYNLILTLHLTEMFIKTIEKFFVSNRRAFVAFSMYVNIVERGIKHP
jgi:hypothetical protein